MRLISTDMYKTRALKIKIMFLLSIFVMYWAGATLFIHKHTYDGVTIVHSHPFSDSSHHHKISDLRWIDMLSHVVADDSLSYCPSLDVQLNFEVRIFAFVSDDVVVSDLNRHIRLRAPPVL